MNPQPLELLLVEDNQLDFDLFEHMLERSMTTEFTISHATKLSDAITHLEQDPPQVVLVDLSLPDSSGIETFRQLAAVSLRVPIIVLTGHDDQDLVDVIFEEGAADFLVKSNLDQDSLARSIRMAMLRKSHDENQYNLNTLSNSLSAASEIQNRLFPKKDLSPDGFDIAGAVAPADYSSGDYYDFIPMEDDCIGLVVGDVAGHGIGPSFIMAEIRAYLRILASLTPCAGDILTEANRMIFDDCGEIFVTLFFARLNPIKRNFTYACAGHPVYHFNAAGQSTTLNDNNQCPLGIMPHSVYDRSEAIPVESGDILYFPTDGIYEATNHRKEFFGVDRMLKAVLDNKQEPADKIVQSVFREAKNFCNGQKQRDDMTSLVVKVN